ncbi:MAG: nucleotidyltransferase [Kiritimatiellae bacterium]|nr:nucleotidyltransferase [Kiritimatiellia bacterium]
MKLTLLIMAAGMGRRYGGLKQIDPIGPRGEIIMDYSIYDAIRTGFGKLVFVIRPEMESAFREAMRHKFEDCMEVHYVHQELNQLPGGFLPPENRSKPWGTGHAVYVAKEVIQEPFVVINADDFYGRDSFEILHNSLASISGEFDYSLVGYNLRNTLSACGPVARGICDCDENLYLRRIQEFTRISDKGGRIVHRALNGMKMVFTGGEYVSMNMWGFTPSIFDHLEDHLLAFLEEQREDVNAEFFIPEVIDTLLAAHKVRVKVLPSEASWFGVTYQEDRPFGTREIQELVERGDYPQTLWG